MKGTLKGMEASSRSKADWRSVVTITSLSPTTYVSRTLPCAESGLSVTCLGCLLHALARIPLLHVLDFMM